MARREKAIESRWGVCHCGERRGKKEGYDRTHGDEKWWRGKLKSKPVTGNGGEEKKKKKKRPVASFTLREVKTNRPISVKDGLGLDHAEENRKLSPRKKYPIRIFLW